MIGREIGLLGSKPRLIEDFLLGLLGCQFEMFVVLTGSKPKLVGGLLFPLSEGFPIMTSR